MLRSTLPPHDEKKSQPEYSVHELPLNLTNSIKLLSDIIALSKFFLKKPTIQNKPSPPDAADALISEILSLDIARETPKDIRYKLSASYVAMAKADLFPNVALTKEDLDALLKFAFLNPLKQGEHVAFFLKRERIFQYIDQCINPKYLDKFKLIVERACALSIIGFASYNLLNSRRTFDKSQKSISTVFDPQNIITSEKNNIIKLIEELSNLKSSTTHSGDIAHYQKEISADIDQMRNTFEGIELELIKIESNQKQELLEKVIPVFLKIKPPIMDIDPEIKNFKFVAIVRDTRTPEKLIKEIDELETKQAYALAKLISQKTALEERTANAEKKLNDAHIKSQIEINELKSTQLELESKNQKLQINLNKANATVEALRHELHHLKNKAPLWYYGLAVTGFVVGAALCSSGVGLLTSASVLGVITLVFSAAIMISSIVFFGYNIYRKCKQNHDIPPPAPEISSKRITTNLTQTIILPHPLKSHQEPTQTDDHALISTKPMFNPKSQLMGTIEPSGPQTSPRSPVSQ